MDIGINNDILLLIPKFFCSLKDICNFLTTKRYLCSFLNKKEYMLDILGNTLENNKLMYKYEKNSKYIRMYYHGIDIMTVFVNYDDIVSLIPSFDTVIQDGLIAYTTDYYTGFTLDKFLSLNGTNNKGTSLTKEHIVYMELIKTLLESKYGWILKILKTQNPSFIYSNIQDAHYSHYIYMSIKMNLKIIKKI